MKILIVDGKGGGIGASLIEKIATLNSDNEIIAVGTNSVATSAMNKVGIANCATGENPIVYNAKKVDFILGPMGILLANSMLGEITPKIANAISESEAKKILIPMNRCNLSVVGVSNKTISEYINEAVIMLNNEIEKRVEK